MTARVPIDHWREVEAGFRGSVMLRCGALVMATAGLVNLGTQLLAGSRAPGQTGTVIAWLLFILGLWLVAGGFSWVASHPFLTRFGFVVGGLHLAQGIYLLVLLFTVTAAAVPPISLTVGRLLATVIFAFLERDWLSWQVRRRLATAAGLLLIKAVARAIGLMPEFGTPLEPLLDAALLLLLTGALLQVAAGIRIQEDAWALIVYEAGHADLGEFNNPEHDWNKKAAPRGAPGRNQGRSK
jgi:hypothetical protein